eukprot:GHVU01029966.1.p3 GENE.GHVU01029966.1~~GHVU01029966.1.p3  ORF type:complete len:141 (+),score=17.82 GHVU01029966.1:239-661(+)
MSISMVEKFDVPPTVIYNSLLSETDLTKMALGAKSSVNPTVGGEFSLFEGGVFGKIKELKKDQKIVLEWRFADWPADVYSLVTINLEKPGEKQCDVKLSQTGIPPKDKFGETGTVENCEEGWRQNFWDKMTCVLGYPKRT